MADLRRRDRGVISVYARGRDYHDVMKGRMKTLAQRLVARFGGDVKVFVDTAPVMEKPLAAAAGLGWQGKHTNLVSRQAWLVALPRRALHHAGPRLPTRRRATTAARAGAASTSAPRTPFPRPTGWMRGAAWPT